MQMDMAFLERWCWLAGRARAGCQANASLARPPLALSVLQLADSDGDRRAVVTVSSSRQPLRPSVRIRRVVRRGRGSRDETVISEQL